MYKYDLRLSEDRFPMLIRETEVPDISTSHSGADDVVKWAMETLDMHRLTREITICIAYDNKMKIIGYFDVSIGCVNGTIVSVREIMMRLLAMGAVKFIMIHNHPSGDPMPSLEDYNVKGKLKDAGQLMEIQLLDFIIIGNGNYYSAKETETERR